jgi:hypothetical protein
MGRASVDRKFLPRHDAGGKSKEQGCKLEQIDGDVVWILSRKTSTMNDVIGTIQGPPKRQLKGIAAATKEASITPLAVIPITGDPMGKWDFSRKI